MIQLKHVSKTYRLPGGQQVHALVDFSLSLPSTGLVFVLGKSGSGKSTLLNMLGALDRPDCGEILVDGVSMKSFSGDELDAYRNTYLGFIFQEYNILNDYSVGSNVALALRLQKKAVDQKVVDEILEKVGLEGLSSRHPKELSGGQKQRVAIARALVKDPRLILADEPTGALDSKTGEDIFDLLKNLSKDRLVLVVSHDRDFAERYADRIIEIKDGVILSDLVKTTLREKKLSEHISLLKDGLLSISSGKDLTEEEFAILDSTLAEKGEETLVSEDVSSSALFKKSTGVRGDGTSLSFEPIQQEPAPDEKPHFKPLKGRLPFFDSFKMGASSLRLKPVRLIATILLAAFSLSLFALTDATFAYSPVEAATTGLEQSGLNYATFYKMGTPVGSYYQSVSMDEDDLASLKKDTGLEFALVKQIRLSFGMNLPDYFSSQVLSDPSFVSLAVYDENYAKSLGFTIYGDYPRNENEIAISEYAYSYFRSFGYVSYKEGTSEVRLSLTKDQVGSEESFLQKGITFDGQFYNSNGAEVDYSFKVTGIIDEGFRSADYALLDEENQTDGEKAQASALRVALSDACRNGFSGMIYTNALTEAAYEKAVGPVSSFSFALGRMPAKDKIRDLVSYSYRTCATQTDYTLRKTGFVLNNYVMELYLNANTLASSGRTAFFWIAFVGAAFASLGLMNFILISISARKREIGILRGLGAKGSDVFFVFFNETLLIVLIEWLLSLLGGWGWCNLFSQSLRSVIGFHLYVFNFGVRQVFVVLAIALLAGFLATFLPTFLISHKKPIDSINNR